MKREMVIPGYHYSLRNSPEERGCHLLGGGHLKSLTEKDSL